MHSSRFFLIVSCCALLLIILVGCGLNTSQGAANNQTCSKESTAASTTQDTDFTGNQITLEGWLFDQMSSDSTKKPETKTKECLTMPEMESSGYGILVKQTEGEYKFYRFDAAGHQAAKKLLSKTVKTKDITIKVTGTLNQAKTAIKILTIEESN